MRKNFMVVLAAMAASALLLAGCSSNTASDSQAAADTGMVQLVNPYVEATDSDIYNQLGIPMYSGAITNLDAEYIVAGSMAQLNFSTLDPEGETVEWTLRAAKDATPDESMHGLYYDDFEDVVEIEEADLGIVLNYTSCDEGRTKLYYWSAADITYTLSYTGEISQMSVSAVLDQVFTAIGLIK